MPFALKDRYLEPLKQSMLILEVGCAEDAEAAAGAAITRVREVGMTMAASTAQFTHAFHAYQSGDHEALVLRYQRAQSAQERSPGGIEPALEKAAAGPFIPAVLTSLDLPSIPLDRIGEIIIAETALGAVTGMPTTPIAMAELARAAHLGQRAEIGPLLKEVRSRLEAEEGDVDPFDVQLDLARILAPVDPAAVPGLVTGVLRASNDPAQQRVAFAWRVQAALHEGQPAEGFAEAVVDRLEEVDRDLEEFGDLPRSVVLEAASRVPAARAWSVDAALADTAPGDPTHLDTFAGAARVLLEHAPADERGPHLREDAHRIARDLDRRNGSTVQSELLRARFFPEG